MDDLKLLIRIAGLITREREGAITPDEKKEMDRWVNENERNLSMYTRFKESSDIYKLLNDLDNIDTKEPFRKTWSRIRKGDDKGRRIYVLPKIMKYAAAVLLLISISAIVYFTIYRIHHANQRQLADIEPGTQKAILITADNRQIELGKRGIKQLFKSRKLSVTDTAQTLTYELVDSTGSETPVIEYNQVIVPRGGEYTLVLADGSKVKLNADSRLRYPVTFSGDIRDVELWGEAFFEVRRSDEKPFLVHTKDMIIQVYGTSFNVSAYDNDNFAHTTLVNGNVGIYLTTDLKSPEIRLNPGEQANFNKLTNKIEKHEVDVGLYTAWVNGIFMFENEPIGNILKKLARWYNIEVEFQSEDLKMRSFTGDLKRYDNISTILDMISIASDLEFTIEGKTVIVSKSK